MLQGQPGVPGKGLSPLRAPYSMAKTMYARAVVCWWKVSPGGYFGRPDSHIGYEILYCQSGRGSITFGDQTVPYHAGCLAYFDSRVSHQIIVNGEYKRWNLCFWQEGLHGLFSNEAIRTIIEELQPAPEEIRIFQVSEENAPRLDRHFCNLRDDIASNSADLALLLPLHLAELHILLKRFRYQVFSVLVRRDEPWLQRATDVLDYIEANLFTTLTAEKVAREFYYSPSHVNRLVRRATGMSLSRYVRARRLHRAKKLLEQTHLTVSAVAEAVGIANIPYFCRAFKDETGCTPGEYRAQFQKAK